MATNRSDTQHIQFLSYEHKFLTPTIFYSPSAAHTGFTPEDSCVTYPKIEDGI